MDKDTLLQQIRSFSAKRLVTREEVTAAFEAGAGDDVEVTPQAGVSRILYYVGGAVVFLGISVLIWQHWSALNNAARILSTLGSGIAAYYAASLFSRDERFEAAGRAFYFIAALVIPLGLRVTFKIGGLDVGSDVVQSLIAGILLVTFLLSYLVDRKTVFTIFNIIFGTWLFFSVTNLFDMSSSWFDWKFSAYRILSTGLTYMLLGYYLAQTSQRALTGALYGFGSFFFLGAALALGDWKPHQNVFWELVFPGLAFGVIFLSVYLKSKAFLTFGSLYLMGYILKITSEYFADSLGWPLALVLTGFGLIAIGFLHFNLKKRYLS